MISKFLVHCHTKSDDNLSPQDFASFRQQFSRKIELTNIIHCYIQHELVIRDLYNQTWIEKKREK
jgi:hypothetical protein